MRYNEKPVEEVPEVAAYLEAESRLQAFKDTHAEIFEEMEQLAEMVNSARQDAEQVCRSREISCGPFELYQYQAKLNADKLRDALGTEAFLNHGGRIEKKEIATFERRKFDALLASNTITEEVADQCYVKAPRFHIPDPVVV